ncbi:MAG: hypothetical protein ACW99F_02105 [Candidatus Hodarchaeales archaeon]|jgi:hypothetical protein
MPNKRTKPIFIILLFLLFSTHTGVRGTLREQELEWFVEVGDSRTFTVIKLFNLGSNDTNRLFSLEGTENNEFIWIITEVGTKITYTITKITESGIVMGQRTIDNSIRLKEEPFNNYLIIRKTIQNQTYWESVYENRRTTELINGRLAIIETHVTSKMISREANYFVNYTFSVFNVTEKIQWEWMSGWILYRYLKFTNDSNLFYEYELVFDSNDYNSGSPNIEISIAIFSIVIIALVIIQIYKRK